MTVQVPMAGADPTDDTEAALDLMDELRALEERGLIAWEQNDCAEPRPVLTTRGAAALKTPAQEPPL